MSLNWKKDKENVVHLQNGLLFLKNDIMKFAGQWMELEKKITLGDATQTQKDKYSLYLLVNR